jgi:hypothetical protein
MHAKRISRHSRGSPTGKWENTALGDVLARGRGPIEIETTVLGFQGNV